jgi:hypothetical protein
VVGGRAGALVLALILAGAVPARGQEPVYQTMIARIKQEGFQRSKVLGTAIGLSDRNGPRPGGSAGYHTNLDQADYLIEDDLRQAAVVLASLVYHTAMRTERMPRLPLPEAHR